VFWVKVLLKIIFMFFFKCEITTRKCKVISCLVLHYFLLNSVAVAYPSRSSGFVLGSGV
jgi:hypothetical protein